MLLQLAFDLNDEDEILSIVPRVVKHVDIIEIGTINLLRYGKDIVEKVRETAPNAVILADAKVADAGRLECGMMFDAGADIVTVLGAMNDITIRSSVEYARERNKEIMVDLIGITDYSAIASKLNPIKPNYICSHVAFDISSRNQLQKQFAELRDAGIDAQLALAGGVTLDNLDEMIALCPDVVIVGRGITASGDIESTVAKFWEKLHEC